MKERGSSHGAWKVWYSDIVVKSDIPKLSHNDALRIRHAIENKIAINPVIYGLPLRGTLKQYWKLRVGDYRIVYAVRNNEIRILVIAHRRDVYKLAAKRM